MNQKTHAKKQKYSIQKLNSTQAADSAEKIVEIYRDCWIFTYPNKDFGITRQDIQKRFINFQQLVDEWKENILGTKKRATWIAFNEKLQMIGFCIAKKDTHYNELEYLYILPQYQGKNIGTTLMNKALRWMGNTKPLILFGARYNNKAIEFYKKFGFVLSDESVPPKILPNGKSIPTMKMIRKPRA